MILKIIYLLLSIFSYCSIWLFPYNLSRKYKAIRDFILSRRFDIITSSKNGCAHLESPIYIIGHKYIHYSNFVSKPGLRLECIDYYEGVKYYPTLVIGKNVNFNFRCHIGVINNVVIGDNVLIGSNVLITDHFHGYSNNTDIHIPPIKRNLYSKGSIIIGNNVWIGDNVCVFPGVKIGDNCIIGANTIVNKDVPENSVVAGNPLKIIRKIKSDVES